MANDIYLFTEINNAVLDLQSAQLQSYERPLKTLGRLLRHPDLEETNKSLTEGLDLEAFLKESAKTQGGMVGSATLVWPDSHEKALGLTLLLIEKFAADPRYMATFGHTFFYSGSKIVAGVHAITRQMIIPFARDYKAYAMSHGSSRRESEVSAHMPVGAQSPPAAQQKSEVVTLKPTFMGMSIDLKELGRRCLPWVKRSLDRSS